MAEGVPPPNDAIQFDKAEYAGSQAPAACCAACNLPIALNYYTFNKTIICEQCQGQVKTLLASGSKFKRAFAATALGVLAGVAGAALWYGVRRATGYELGIIAIAVGVMVGVAVRKGSKGRGGWFYQTLAIVLTYCCISAQYVPDIVEGMLRKFQERHAALVHAQKNPLGSDAHDKTAAKNASAEIPRPNDAMPPRPGIVKTTLAIALFLVIAFFVSLALPFWGITSNPISLLIIGFGLYEAWKINRVSVIQVAGPFRLAPSAAPGLPGT